MAGIDQLVSTTPGKRPTPSRRRFRRLKWALPLIALLALAVVVTRIWWGWQAEKRFQALIEDSRRRGEPLDEAAFIRPPIPQNQNAAFFLLRAVRNFQMTPEQQQRYQKYDVDEKYEVDESLWWGRWPMCPHHAQLVAEWKAGNPQFFADLTRARQCTQADWGSPFSMNLNQLNEAREMPNIIRMFALYEHHLGNDDQAVEHLRDILIIARLLREDWLAVSNLVALGIQGLTLDVLEQILPTLAIEGGPPTTRPSRPATRQQLRALVAELLEEQHIRLSLHRGILFERVETILATRREEQKRIILSPADVIHGARQLEFLRHAQDALDETSWPAVNRLVRLPGEIPFPDQPRIERLKRYFEADRYWGLIWERHYRGVAASRMNAVAVAIAMYRADHGGVWPAKLEPLVPAYLTAIPLDPFAADGRPLSYIAGENPRLYSSGTNCTDDNGSNIVLSGASSQIGRPASYLWGGADAVLYLTPQPKPAPDPSLQAPPDNPEEPQAPGDQ